MNDKAKILEHSRELLVEKINKDNIAFGGSNPEKTIDLESYRTNLANVLQSLKLIKEIGDIA